MKNVSVFFALLFSASNLIAQIPNYVPLDSLQCWFGFNGSVNDESINNINGSIIGNVSLTQDRFGNNNSAYNFGTTGSYIDYGDVDEVEGTDSLTVSVWLYANSLGDLPPWNQTIPVLSKWYSSTANDVNSFNFVLAGDTMVMSFSDNVNDESVYSPLNFSINEWVHIAFTFDRGQVNVYQNGVLINDSTLTVQSIYNSTEGFTIGDWFYDVSPSFYQTFLGNLDDIGIWNRVLTECEIQALYSASQCGLGLKEESNFKKELIGVYDLLGRKTEFKLNTPLVYIYSDGSTEKVFITE